MSIKLPVRVEWNEKKGRTASGWSVVDAYGLPLPLLYRCGYWHEDFLTELVDAFNAAPLTRAERRLVNEVLAHHEWSLPANVAVARDSVQRERAKKKGKKR